MVVCINQPCGSFAFESDDEEITTGQSNTQKLVKQLRPNFHCSSRPANLDNVNYTIHPALAALWNEAEEWHLLASDHCDGKKAHETITEVFKCFNTYFVFSYSSILLSVYGFNVWSPAWLDESTEMVFDGDAGRKKWLKTHKNQVINKRGNVSGLESCASEGWVCSMAFSEFDYLLICIEPKKAEYGNVHHINTRNTKESYCCTMDDLLIHLAYFVREGTDRKMAEHHGTKNTVKPRAGLPRPLKMLRKSMLDAMTR